jgi:two-component system OmpR family response regulator
MPMIHATHAPEGSATRDPFDPGVKAVLVIEDDPWIADLLGLLLKRNAAHVVVASDGQTAEAALMTQSGAIELVVMDCNLPDIRPVELAARLRRLTPRVPILLTSGRRQEAVWEELKAGGPTEFLSKPFARSDLQARLRSLFEVTLAA